MWINCFNLRIVCDNCRRGFVGIGRWNYPYVKKCPFYCGPANFTLIAQFEGIEELFVSEIRNLFTGKIWSLVARKLIIIAINHNHVLHFEMIIVLKDFLVVRIL